MHERSREDTKRASQQAASALQAAEMEVHLHVHLFGVVGTGRNMKHVIGRDIFVAADDVNVC